MLESRQEPIAPRHVFLWRVFKFMSLALAVIATALVMGIAGYHYIADFTWVDSILNASMILGDGAGR